MHVFLPDCLQAPNMTAARFSEHVCAFYKRKLLKLISWSTFCFLFLFKNSTFIGKGEVILSNYAISVVRLCSIRPPYTTPGNSLEHTCSSRAMGPQPYPFSCSAPTHLGKRGQGLVAPQVQAHCKTEESWKAALELKGNFQDPSGIKSTLLSEALAFEVMRVTPGWL